MLFNENTLSVLHKEEWGRLLAALIADLGDIELAEDSLQDAFAGAFTHWEQNGLPANPSGWIYRAARNRAVDKIRRQAVFGDKRNVLEAQARALEAQFQETTEQEAEDKRLLLLFTCCHPALAERDQIALTLQTLGGLTTKEIARAFLTAEPTMAQRLLRTKKKIKKTKIPYVEPSSKELPQRLRAVQSVIYLIFSEGYAARTGSSPVRLALVQEAIKLCETLAHLCPRDPEVAGLWALMLLHDSRRPARFKNQRPVPLDQQDRTLWDQKKIALGTNLLDSAMLLGQPGPYQVQAAISALHGQASTSAETDWKQIVLLYDRLHIMTGSIVVRLNAAVARSFAEGPSAALTILDEIAATGQLSNYQPYFAARADILRRCGEKEEARAFYHQALALTENQGDRLFLNDRLVELERFSK